MPCCGIDEGFADAIGGGGDVGGEAGFKETGESTEGSVSICGGFVYSCVSSSFCSNRAMKPSLPLRKPRFEEWLAPRRRPVEELLAVALLAVGLLAVGWLVGEQQVVDWLAFDSTNKLDRTD